MDNVIQIWLTINHAVQKSFNVLLQLSSQQLQLPPECQASMATTLPAGILTTHHPPLITSTLSSTTVPSTTPMPLYLDDTSAIDDYSYFTQTDDYKYFGTDRESTTTPTTMTEASRRNSEAIDYWVDLGEDLGESSGKPNQSHSQRDVEPLKNPLEENEDEVIFAEPARFETRGPSSISTGNPTSSPPSPETSQVTRAPVPLNSGNFATFYSLLLFFCFL
ncbi:hypothetical protein FO519_005652 [Halicephalobus sp. NKZ332]|nr:hypothetical protein FO519_005652 [Halicephalobus sp. NKZ332]